MYNYVINKGVTMVAGKTIGKYRVYGVDDETKWTYRCLYHAPSSQSAMYVCTVIGGACETCEQYAEMNGYAQEEMPMTRKRHKNNNKTSWRGVSDAAWEQSDREARGDAHTRDQDFPEWLMQEIESVGGIENLDRDTAYAAGLIAGNRARHQDQEEERMAQTESQAESRKLVAVCHEGTGTGNVAAMLRERGVELRVVRTREAAHYCEFDFLILLGGTDIQPFWYGEEATHAYGFDDRRDIIEYTLIRRAMTKKVPIMGICRGHQMICAAFGGTLYQDIDLQGAARGHGSFHKLSWIDPMLAAYMPSGNVNSYHHQAVKDVPYGFDVLAYSDDGLVESIWKPGVLGIQWHPELLYSYKPEWGAIMDWFIAGLQEPLEIPAKRETEERVGVEVTGTVIEVMDFLPEGESDSEVAIRYFEQAVARDDRRDAIDG